jgi:hypothetical protein
MAYLAFQGNHSGEVHHHVLVLLLCHLVLLDLLVRLDAVLAVLKVLEEA